MHRLRSPRLFAVAFLASVFLLSTPLSAAETGQELRGDPAFARALTKTCTGCRLLDVERRVLFGSIVEYSFTLRVGAGEHEVIGVHRVVREAAPFVPVRTRHAVMMAHGDVWGFDTAFLTAASSPAIPDHHALPVFLAQRGVDVWGIDFRWTLVPGDTADLSFMADWGIETDARDLRLAMALARLTRGLGGDGLGRLILLGWSRGGQIGYAALDAETQLPPVLRQIKGFIPVDIYLKTDQPDLVAAACLRFAGTQAQQDAGQFADTTGILIASLAQLAITAPADPSPIFAGLSNRQAALLVGVATFQLLPPGAAFVPLYHFTGGSFDASGLPDGLLYQGEAGFIDFLAGAAPLEPLQVLADGDAAICGPSAEPPVPDVGFDDHLDEITVPVLYVGAGGGFGDYGIYTTTLLGSTDVTSHVVSLVPPEQRLFDLGHADIFQADDADTLFWQPILDWIRTH